VVESSKRVKVGKVAEFFVKREAGPMARGAKHNDQEVTLERLERARTAISYAIMLDGPVYAPYLERLEREIAAMRAKEDVVSRAKQYLELDQATTASRGDVKAIA
jgi:hypothetical protein